MKMISTTSISKLLLAVLLLLAVTAPVTVNAQPPCHICGDRGNEAMSHPHVILANVGRTCNQIALDVAMGTPFGSQQCSTAQNDWRDRCCTNNRPAGRDPPPGLPAQNIPTVQYVGPNPPCRLCRDGDFPWKTSMVINFLYIGEGSCAQYYRYGLEGRIESHMCDPVKFFSYEPCGCGEFNPYFNPNHPLNQQAQQAPGTNNGNGGGNSGGGGGGGGSGGGGGGGGQSPQQQRQPENGNDKNGDKMSGQRGGNGGGPNMRRLKGQRPKMVQHAPPASSTTTTTDVVSTNNQA